MMRESGRRVWFTRVAASAEMLKARPDLVLDAAALAPADAVDPEIIRVFVKRPSAAQSLLDRNGDVVLLAVVGNADVGATRYGPEGWPEDPLPTPSVPIEGLVERHNPIAGKSRAPRVERRGALVAADFWTPLRKGRARSFLSRAAALKCRCTGRTNRCLACRAKEVLR